MGAGGQKLCASSRDEDLFSGSGGGVGEAEGNVVF